MTSNVSGPNRSADIMSILVQKRTENRAPWKRAGFLVSLSVAVLLMVAGLLVYRPVWEQAEVVKLGRWGAILPIIAMAYGSLLLLGMAVVVSRMQTEREGTLRFRAETLDELVAYLTVCQEEERKQICSKLHDDIGSLITALKIELEGSDLAVRDPSRWESILEMLEKLLHEVRSLSVLLYPKMIGTLSFEQDVEELVQRLDSDQLQVSLHWNGKRHHLDKETRLCVLRIIQEAVINARRHAGGQSVRVVIKGRDGVMEGTIDDDGKGWNDDAEGMGLILMRERVRKLQGALWLASSPEGGARVGFSVPVQAGSVKACERASAEA